MYVLDHIEAPWGDYGSILVHGMSLHLDRIEGRIQLERAGPFIPPVTLPGVGDVIVTDEARRGLEGAVPGLVFRVVEKARIVRIDWHTWSREAAEPPEYPSSGEPEDYLLERSHDPLLAEQLGALWELVPEIVPSIQLPGGKLNRAAYRGQDLVRASEMAGYNFVSERLKNALSVQGGAWVTFRPAE